jgi:hypothetical protein
MSEITLIPTDLQEKYFKQQSYIYHSANIEEQLLIDRDYDIWKFCECPTVITSLPPGAIVAGGYVLGLMINKISEAKDIDVFFKNEEAFLETTDILQKNGYKKSEPESTISFADTFHKPGKLKIQLVRTLWFNSAEHVIDTFDFTVCQFAIESGFLIFNPMSVIDASKKQLVLNRLNFPKFVKKRMEKYTLKGYRAVPGVNDKIEMAIKDTDGHWSELETRIFPLSSLY